MWQQTKVTAAAAANTTRKRPTTYRGSHLPKHHVDPRRQKDNKPQRCAGNLFAVRHNKFQLF